MLVVGAAAVCSWSGDAAGFLLRTPAADVCVLVAPEAGSRLLLGLGSGLVLAGQGGQKNENRDPNHGDDSTMVQHVERVVPRHRHGGT